jgi:hypothetical protein
MHHQYITTRYVVSIVNEDLGPLSLVVLMIDTNPLCNRCGLRQQVNPFTCTSTNTYTALRSRAKRVQECMQGRTVRMILVQLQMMVHVWGSLLGFTLAKQRTSDVDHHLQLNEYHSHCTSLHTFLHSLRSTSQGSVCVCWCTSKGVNLLSKTTSVTQRICVYHQNN